MTDVESGRSMNHSRLRDGYSRFFTPGQAILPPFSTLQNGSFFKLGKTGLSFLSGGVRQLQRLYPELLTEMFKSRCKLQSVHPGSRT